MIKNHCDQCDSVYETKECLRRHVIEKHEGEKDLFRGHLKSRHNGTLDADKRFRNLRFNCCECDYQTRKKRLLTGHMNNYHQSSPDACCQSK